MTRTVIATTAVAASSRFQPPEVPCRENQTRLLHKAGTNMVNANRLTCITIRQEICWVHDCVK